MVDFRDGKSAFALIKKFRPQALIVPTLIVIADHLDEIVRFALVNQLATVGESAEFAEAGLLYAYGANVPMVYKRAAYLIDRILKGAKPSELPYEQPTVFDVAVNLKTAKELRIMVPEVIMARATKVIK